MDPCQQSNPRNRTGAWPLAVLAVMVLSALPAPAQTRRVTLKLDQVTEDTAVRKLGEAAGYSLDVAVPLIPPAAVKPATPERASFEWKGVPFADALRQLCARYNLMPTRRPGGYTLSRADDAPPARPGRRVGLFERNGIRIFPRSITLTGETRSVNFEGGDAGEADGSMSLVLGAELGDRDAESVAGVTNLVARDDAGGTSRSSSDNIDVPTSPNSYPDEWTGMLYVNPPRRGARKLVWVQGDLTVYRTYKPVLVEVPWSAAKSGTARRQGDWTITIAGYQAQYRPQRPAAVAGPAGPGAPGDPFNGPSIEATLEYPPDSRYRPRVMGTELAPVLIGASGRVYAGQAVHGSGGGDGQMMRFTSVLVFPGMKEQEGKLVWELVEKADPVKLLTFRLENIPLPVLQAGAAVPQAVPAPIAAPPAAAPPEATHPFFQAEGGELQSTVRMAEQGVAGTLHLGLRPRQGAGWGPVRWTELEVGPDGEVRLGDLKPGAYRLLRTFRPKSGALPAGGTWAGGELAITIQPHKATAVPPLRWEPPKAPRPIR